MIRRVQRQREDEVLPEEVFADALQDGTFDKQQLEGMISRPLSSRVFFLFGVITCIAGLVFILRIGRLQLVRGDDYARRASSNALAQEIIFNKRGVIYDRDNNPLVWNEPHEDNLVPYAKRKYIETPGMAHVLGYIQMPQVDSGGNFWQVYTRGISGAEIEFNTELVGRPGYTFNEGNAWRSLGGNVESIQEPQDGENVSLTIDLGIQSALGNALNTSIQEYGYEGAAAMVMNVETGALRSSVSLPEFSSEILSLGEDTKAINSFFGDTGAFLNRAVSGLYSPGSTVKPFVALAALNEGILDQDDTILSTGRIVIPNPYQPDKPSIFRDWKDGGHGLTDVKKAISDSVNTYFYTISGGYNGVEGLGIKMMASYMKDFGIGHKGSPSYLNEVEGVVPTPSWKKKVFDEPWRLGDTYITSIGQFGFQVTPIQMLRATASLYNGGNLVTPHIHASKKRSSKRVQKEFSTSHIQLIQEAMRQTVTTGTAKILNDLPEEMQISAKTGTAQVGVNREYINSWIIGTFIYKSETLAYVVVLERGPNTSKTPAASRMLQAAFVELQKSETEKASKDKILEQDSEVLIDNAGSSVTIETN